MAYVKHFTDATFQREVLSAPGPVLVDFTAAWCGPCKMLAPVVEQLAADLEGRLTVGKLDIDESVETAMAYAVMSVPTLLLFMQGQPVERLVGYMPKARIAKKLQPHLGG